MPHRAAENSSAYRAAPPTSGEFAGEDESSGKRISTVSAAGRGVKLNDMSEADENLVPDTEEEEGARPQLPPPDFEFLVYSLRLQAELNLGLLPFGEKRKPDFELGRHNIDLLAVLQEKTKGNLSIEEQRSLDNSVTELRFRFVQARESHARAQTEKEQQEKEKQLKENPQSA